MITNGVVPAGTVVNGASLFNVPPGPATMLLSATGAAGTVYVGAYTTSGTLTAANGFPVYPGLVPPVVIPLYAGSGYQQFAVLAPGGTASLSWLVSDPTGRTGTGLLG